MPSRPDVPPEFQIHAELAALPQELVEDNFDLRSASTQREPLASRKQRESADWTPHAPAPESERREPEPSVRPSRHSSSAVTILVDRGLDALPPTSDRLPAAQPATVPLTWVLGAAAFAVVLALLMAWVLRAPAAPQAVREVDGRASAAAPSVLPQAVPEVAPSKLRPPEHATSASAPSASVTRAQSALPKAAAPRAPTSAAAPATSQAPVPVDPSSKAHQSIY